MNDQIDSFEEEILPSTPTSFSDETILWEGRPSQWVNFGTFLFWGVMFVFLLFFNLIWKGVVLEGYGEAVSMAVNYAIYGVVFMGLFSVFHAYLTVYYEHTSITSNKIKEAKGITRIFRRERFCEISDILDVTSPPPGIIGLLGLSSLLIETKDNDQPLIRIRAIKNREELIAQLLPL